MGGFKVMTKKLRKKNHPKNREKFSKIKKNILRTMVKTPAQTDGWLKSHGQNTAQKSPLGPKYDF